MNAVKNKPLLTGYIFAIGATVFWSGNFIVARELNQSVPPVSLSFWRWFVAVIVLFPVFLLQIMNNEKADTGTII
jgi:drug/metabolite transporter (DMT)-like permease